MVACARATLMFKYCKNDNISSVVLNVTMTAYNIVKGRKTVDNTDCSLNGDVVEGSRHFTQTTQTRWTGACQIHP